MDVSTNIIFAAFFPSKCSPCALPQHKSDLHALEESWRSSILPHWARRKELRLWMRHHSVYIFYPEQPQNRKHLSHWAGCSAVYTAHLGYWLCPQSHWAGLIINMASHKSQDCSEGNKGRHADYRRRTWIHQFDLHLDYGRMERSRFPVGKWFSSVWQNWPAFLWGFHNYSRNWDPKATPKVRFLHFF